MNIGRKDKNGKRYYTFEDIPKIHKLTEFFKYGFYIALAIWKINCRKKVWEIIEERY